MNLVNLIQQVRDFHSGFPPIKPAAKTSHLEQDNVALPVLSVWHRCWRLWM